MGKQRDVFKEEIRNMKNDMKNNENKHEVCFCNKHGGRGAAHLCPFWQLLVHLKHLVVGVACALKIPCCRC